MKPKKGSSSMECNPIQISTKFHTENTTIQATIEKLRSERYIDEQQKLIKTLISYLLIPQELEFTSSLLTYLFLTVDSKHPIRKTILKVLLTANNELVKKTLSENIVYLIKAVKEDSNCTLANQYGVVINVQNCFNNFPLGIESISSIIDYVISYIMDIFFNLVEFLSFRRKEKVGNLDVYSHLYNVTKLLVSLLQQCTLARTLPNYSIQLMLATYKIIMDTFISFDIKCNCGLLMVISVNHMPDHITDNLKAGSYFVSLLKLDQTNKIQRFLNFEDLMSNNTANLCIYSGILNATSENVLCEEMIDGVPVISFMFSKLLDYAKRFIGKPAQLLEVGRALILISKIMITIPLSSVESMFAQGIDYVWIHLDHFVDTVKHSAKTIFENLIKIAYKHYKNGYMQLLKMILTNMIDLLVNRCTHYIALTILSAETGCSFLLEQFTQLPFTLLNNIADSSIAPQICSTYELLMVQHAKEEDDVNKWMELWVEPVKPLLIRSVFPETAFYQRLLISAYKIQPLVLQSIMHYQHNIGANELGTLLGCLKVARKNGLSIRQVNSELNNTRTGEMYWRGYLEFESLKLMMCHQSDEVRISVLALVVECQKSTEIFSTWELNFLKNYFHYNVTTQIPNTRQQMIALYKKALIRLKESLAVLIKHHTAICNKLKAEAGNTDKAIIEELQLYKRHRMNYKVFVETFFQDHLCCGFHSGYNFQRRATCLELIAFMINENCIEQEDLDRNWKSSDTMALLNVLCDSHESNVTMAFNIIKKLPPRALVLFQSKELVRSNILNTIALASSIKPTNATAAGYILPIYLATPYAREIILDIMQHTVNFDDTYVLTISCLIHLVEEGMRLAKKNILEAVKTPVYGYILCIRHLLDKGYISTCKDWEYLVAKLVYICKFVSDIVSPIVNNLSPEGYIPLEDELTKVDIKNETVTPQMVLVYAWRTTKEVSLLLGELTLSAPDIDCKTGAELLSSDIMSLISEHFLKIFLETKHRGAYEQAYLGFCKFCEKLWRSPNEVFKSWPKMWLVNILLTLKGKNKDICHTLCSTRRSAGLPFMIQAIVITEPKDTGNTNFHLCMETLLTIAANTSHENIKSRIHAMNIVRLLYRNNQSGELVARYITKGVIVALQAFNNDNWGVRNASTILFATLVIRIFGVQRNRDMDELSVKNRMSAKVFFNRYFSLCDFLLHQLITGSQNNRNATVLHPVLLILERLYPCTREEQNQLGKYALHVTKCFSNCIYKIRELAAQTSASLTTNLEVITCIKNILINLSDVTQTNNSCQSSIMQLIYLLRFVKKGYALFDIAALIEPTFWIFISVGKYISHYTGALYFDMLVSLSSVFLKNCQDALIFDKLVEILIWQSVKDNCTENVLSTARKKYNLCRYNLHMHVVSNLYHCDSYVKSLYIKELILSGLYSVNEEINIYCLNYINYLYFHRLKQTKHSLYITEQLQVSEREYKAVASLDTTAKEYVIKGVHKDLERKLLPIFCHLSTKSKECCLCGFLILQHFSSVLNEFKPHKQELLDFLMNWCECDDEIFCASINVISIFLNSLSDNDIRQLNCSVLLKVIIDASAPTSTLHERISAAQFLVANRRLLCEPSLFLNGEEVVNLWHTAIILLEDDDQFVRDTISQLGNTDPISVSTWSELELPTIAEKAREDLLSMCVEFLPSKICIPLLLSWALRRTSEETIDSIDVFDKGEINPYAEEEQLARLATNCLRNLLWKLDDGLNYEDSSIFIEEHTLMVATTIYNALYQYLPTMGNINVKVTLLCIIRKLLDFLDRCPINKHNFKLELEEIMVKEFAIIVSKEFNRNAARTKYILKCLFNIERGLS